MFMYVWFIWLLVFTTGASVAQFLHRDKLTDRLRDRWEVHWDQRIERALLRSDGMLNIAGLARGERDPKKLRELREEMLKRSAREPGVPFRTRRAERELRRPWSTRVAELDRLSMYSTFPSCKDCLPYWPYLAFTIVVAGWAFGFSSGGFLAAVDITAKIDVSPWYAGFVVIVQLPLTFRWLYALIARD